MQTDIFGKEIHILPNLHATSWGAALIAISALEKQDLSNKAPLSRKEIFYPNEENHHHYQKQYQLYKDTYNHIMQ
jgi:sugar (pentulose or hexulose) kinase